MLTKLVLNFLANELAELLESAESRATKPEWKSVVLRLTMEKKKIRALNGEQSAVRWNSGW